MSAPRQTPALQAQDLCVTLGDRPVLRGVSLSLAPGRWTCIAGPNGAGKSTLLKAMAGLLPHQGQVSLLGRPLAQWPGRERARALAWLGQGEHGAEDLSVWDVAMLGRLPHQGWLASPSEADRQAVEQALRATQAWDWRQRPMGALSGGERQRVLLARLLAVQAQVMLMDEPLANLDPPHQADWWHLVRQQVGQGRTVVSVLHEVGMALLADDLVVLRQGQVAYAGPAQVPEAHRALEAVFEHRISIQAVGERWVALPI
ncbi:ABC transporter ATP-binding protein [Hydrogenophaga sp.]|uniref:ABC transporter ATP-binding protein n=1 Tax=Hydrogenophaga sp. TaxID=1904254 RepID=UPI0035B3DA27